MRHHFPLLAALVLLSCAPSCNSDGNADLEKLLSTELKRHPESDIDDLYKLLHQSAFGVGHIIASREQASRYLDEEIRSMPRFEGEPLFESCDPGGKMVRVNLRPYLSKGYAPETLIDVMLASAAAIRADTAAFVDTWNAVGELVESGKLPFDYDEFTAFTDDVREQGYPPVHHSRKYAAAYRPAYRVVLKEIFLKRFPDASK
jgi:hypothetical protein